MTLHVATSGNVISLIGDFRANAPFEHTWSFITFGPGLQDQVIVVECIERQQTAWVHNQWFCLLFNY